VGVSGVSALVFIYFRKCNPKSKKKVLPVEQKATPIFVSTNKGHITTSSFESP